MPTVTVSSNTTTVVLDDSKGTVTLGSSSTLFVSAYLARFGSEITDKNAYGVWNHLKERIRNNPEVDVEYGTKGVVGSIGFLRDWTDTTSEINELKDHIVPDSLDEFTADGTSAPASLAPLLADPRFFQDANYQAFAIKVALQNGPVNTPVPLVLISVLAEQPDAKFRDYTGNDYNATPAEATNGPTRGDFAQGACENWFSYATLFTGSISGTIDPGLPDLYVAMNPGRAKAYLSELVKNSMTANGTCPQLLMDALLKADSAASTLPVPSSASPPVGFAPLDRTFDAAPPVVSGWAYLALISLTRGIDSNANRPGDAQTLEDLTETNQWAAGYVRWYALKKQAPTGTLDAATLAELNAYRPAAASAVCQTAVGAQLLAHQDPDVGYLQILAKNNLPVAAMFTEAASRAQITAGRDPAIAYLDILKTADLQLAGDLCKTALEAQLAAHRPLSDGYLNILALANPAAAATLINADCEDALQPTTRLAPVSDTLGLGYVTNQARPTIRVDLENMGIPGPRIDDRVKLWVDGVLIDGDFPVSATGSAFGWQDIALPPTAAPLGNGPHTIVTTFVHTDANGVKTESLPSIPLTIKVGSALVAPANGYLDPGKSVVTFKLDTVGLQNVAVSPSDFTVTGLGAQPHVVDAQLDCTKGIVMLILDSPIADYSLSKINYAGTSPIVDLAGNRLRPFANMALTVSNELLNVFTRGPAVLPAQRPPRQLNLPAWTILDKLDPRSADHWMTRFKTAGLVTEEPKDVNSNPEDLTGLSPDELAKLDIETRLRVIFEARAARVEDLLAAQIDVVQKKNEMLAKVSDVQTALNKLAALVPPDAHGDFNVSKVAGFAAARDEVNAAIRAANIKPFSTPDGLMVADVQFGPLKSAIEAAKGAAEGLSNNLQIDMLKLQSYTNRRNECYDLVSNFLQKMNSLRQNIVGNMRT